MRNINARFFRNIIVIVCLFASVSLIWTISARLQWDEKEKNFARNVKSNHAVQMRQKDNAKFKFEDGYDLDVSRIDNNANGSPTVFASADFNEDGVQDLVAGTNGNQISVWQGNVDSIYPNSPQAQTRRAEGVFNEQPFYSFATNFNLPETPGFIGGGDFNADGHKDVLSCAFGSDSFYILTGDGRGNFLAPRQFKLKGKITAIAAGEFSRADGQTDIAVAFQTDRGAQVAVYEFPEGAFKATPEFFRLPAPATEIKMGQLDEDELNDLAIACGNQLVFVHGHEQLYPWTMMDGANLKRPAAQVGQRMLPFNISALAIGNFDNSRRETVAMLESGGSVHLLEPPAPFSREREKGRRGERETGRRGDGAKIPDDLLMNVNLPTNGDFNSYKVIDKAKQRAMEDAGNPQPQMPVKDGKIDYDALAKNNVREYRKTLNGKVPPEPVAKPIDLKFAKAFETKPSRINEWRDTVWSNDARLSNTSAQAGRRNIITPVRVSGSGTDDLLVIDGYGKRLHIISNYWARGTAEAATRKTTEIVTLDVASNPLQVLPMRLNSDAWSDLVVLREGSNVPSVMMSAPAASFTVNTAIDDFGDCFNVGGNCTLRSAIDLANASAGTTSILFNIPGGGVHTIQPNFELPAVRGSVIIDGTTQPGYSGTPLIEIKGNLLTGPKDGLKIRASNSTVRGLAINEFPHFIDEQSTIGGNGLTLESTVNFPNNNNNIVEGNYLGTDPTGTLIKGNQATGLNIFDSDQNIIGGIAAGARNVISGNGFVVPAPNPMASQHPQGVGIQFINGNNNQFLGNYIGVSASGQERLGNENGIFGGGSNNVFGGDTPNAGNVISGNGFAFDEGGGNMYCRGNGLAIVQVVDLANGTNQTFGNTIRGNRIGTGADGMNGIGNCFAGIDVPSNANTIIGSITQTGRNVVSGNGDSAIQAQGGLVNVVGGFTSILGNNIGTNINGTASIPIILPAASDSCSGFCTFYGDVWLVPTNGGFITFGSPGGTTQGGACTGFCNLVSGLHQDSNQINVGLLPGLYVQGSGSLGIFNNYIGSNGTGTGSIPNGTGGGIQAFSQATVFIGAVFGAPGNQESGGNLIVEALYLGQISFNPFLQPANYYLLGNLVGTDVTGTISLPKTGNNYNSIQGHPNGAAVIGNSNPLGRNVFSGSVNNFSGHGLTLLGYGIVQNNVFGRDKTESIPIPNQGHGIYIGIGPNIIGGTAPGRVEQNVIANNNGAGIYLDEFEFNNGNRISANRIFQNVGLGIDLAPLGVNANDFFDLDEGANRRQNYPVLKEPVFNPDGTVTLEGSLLSAPDTRFLIGIFATQQADPTMYGEGGFYQGSVAATSNANGLATFTFTTTETFTPDIKFSAVAQDPDRNSSEFSCIAGQCFADLNVKIDDNPDPVEAGMTLTYSVRIHNAGPAAAPNTNLAFTLPTLPYNFISATIPNGNCAQNGNQVDCNLNSMDPNEVSVAEIKITPTQTGRITTTAEVASDAPDPNINDNKNTEDTEVTGPPIVVNRTGDQEDADTNDSVCDIDEGMPENQCTLRAAIQVANHLNGRDYIKFDIEGAGVHTITPSNSLPEITEAVLIDGTTQTGYAGTPVIQLSGASAGALVNGLFITGGTTTVKGLVINGFGGYGILIQGAAGSNVEACFIGTDATGDSVVGNFLSGIRIKDSNNNTIGGATPEKRNIISGNGVLEDPVSLHGVQIDGSSTGNKVQGNYIGTNVDGTTDLGNKGAGVGVFRSNNTVGGATLAPATGEGNLISGNDQAGVFVASNDAGNTVSNVTVQGNLIGTDANGTSAIPNNQYGVFFAGQVQNCYVGGGAPGSRNIISGNTGYGVAISAPPNAGFNASNNFVQGNYIGADVLGMNRLPNTLTGVFILDAHDNFIGGTNAATRNLISGNDERGIAIGQTDPSFNTSYNNVIKGNYIGTNADGSSSLYNKNAGIQIGNGASGNMIGGTSPNDRNIISGNRTPDGSGTGLGILINTEAKSTNVLGNYIGTNPEGDSALANFMGVVVASGASNTNIGLNNTGRNVISGNVYGIFIGGVAQPDQRAFESMSKERKQIINEAAFKAMPLIASYKIAQFDFRKVSIFKNVRFTETKTTNRTESISLTTANVIANNYIGTDVTGSQAVGNTQAGIWVSDEAQDTRIGGVVEGRNLISGNTVSGIAILSMAADSPTKPVNTKVFDNRIGTNTNGNGAIQNGNGIVVSGAANTFIGGTSGAGNLISGNTESGVSVTGMDSNGVFIKGNFIGTNAAGTTAISNQKGVVIENSVGNLVGVDLDNEEKNIISGNTLAGVILFNIPDGQLTNTVAGNYIGADVTGNAVINGQPTGIGLVNASSSFIGGDSGEDFNRGNVIGGNESVGISFENSSGNFVTANNIGVGINAQSPLRNGFGIGMTNNSADNRITQNYIQSSISDGVLLEGGSSGNFFRNNIIGGIEGLDPLGNGRSGVRIKDGAHDNNFGDRFTGGNTIQYNGRSTPSDGVTIEETAGVNNLIDPTLFKGNTRMAIDLNGDGIVTPNDAGDADEGPNRLQNYPEIVSAQINEFGNLIVTYRVDTDPANANYGADGLYVEFFISTTRNEGHTFLGSDFYTQTDYFSGNKTIFLGSAATLGISAGERVTATASDADGNTSEFYPAFIAPTAAGASISGRITNANNQGAANITVTLVNLATGEAITTTTNNTGDYRFENVIAGQTYIVAASSTQYRFSPPNQFINFVEELTGVNFIATPN